MKASETEKLCASILAHERDQERTADCAKRFVSWLAGDTFEHTSVKFWRLCVDVCVWHGIQYQPRRKFRGKCMFP